MTSRRTDMWKLLFNLINRNDTDLNEVFDFVDDILCKEPSLIRPYSLKPLNNHFQDTFLIWMVNKFVSYFNECSSNDLHHANANIQKRILSSCFVNRSALFRKLAFCYVSALAELSVELQGEPHHSTLEVHSFNADDECLKRIDSNASFLTIQVGIENVDFFIKNFLDILKHAQCIGYEVYPELFVESILNVLKCFKVGELYIKQLSFEYCHALFKVTFELNATLDFYYKLVVDSMASLWEQMSIWLHANFVNSTDLETISEISAALLDDYCRYDWQTKYGQLLLQHGIGIFTNVVSLSEMFTSSSGCDRNLQTLHQSLITFMIHLQKEESRMARLSDEQTSFLVKISKEHPGALRIVAIALTKSEDLFKKTVLQISTLFSKGLRSPLNSLNCVEHLKEVFLLLLHLDITHCKRQQLVLMRQVNGFDNLVRGCDTLTTLQHFLPGVTEADKGEKLNRCIEEFIKNASKDKDSESYASYIEISGILLQIQFYRKLLKLEILTQLLSYIEEPLKNALRSSNNVYYNRDACHIAMRSLSNVPMEVCSMTCNQLQNTVTMIVRLLFTPSSSLRFGDELQNAFFDNLLGFIVNDSLKHTQLLQHCLLFLRKSSADIARVLKVACCTSNWDCCFAFGASKYSAASEVNLCENLCCIELVCTKCTTYPRDTIESVSRYMMEKNVFFLRGPSEVKASEKYQTVELLDLVKRFIPNSLLSDEKFSFVLTHFEISAMSTNSLEIITRNDINSFNLVMLQLYMHRLTTDVDACLDFMSRYLLNQAFNSLEQRSQEQQLRVLEQISLCAQNDRISDLWLFHLFKVSLFFLVHPDSKVAHEAVLCATEMCYIRNIKPIQLWHWYKRDALGLIVKVALHAYLIKGVRLTRSLKSLTKMLGFSCVQEFICKYYRLLTTMILPYCVKDSRCKGLIVGISKVTRKPISQIFIISFLRIYSHICLTEETCIGNKCINLILKCTDFSLKKLMCTDVKQTVSEFLIYFNRAPKFVMQAFQCLLLNETTKRNILCCDGVDVTTGSSSSDFAKFIADRFLGVITYFEACLGEPNFEKPLKEEALYSLGQIIRFVGPNHVTQFRFKIIAMLSFVLTLEDKQLQSICLKIWKIFLNIVDIEQIGPSLSRIVACLQPLLEEKNAEVNAIYDFIFLKNDSLVGTYIPELYFVENLSSVSPEIRQSVGRQMEIIKRDKSTTRDKLQFFAHQITNESVQVRIYGLIYMTKFISENRAALNRMVLEEIRIDPLIQKVVDILITGSKHEDKKLQLASAKCLGELGAIDPSYMSSNYSLFKSNEMSLSIHTDEFAIVVLTELCRAYQFQKDSKYVDSFSLAIQETLLTCGVSPKDREKMNVWQAMSERMRQIMEPLLTSCYTSSCRESKCKEHPIFNSTFCRSYEDWAFAWASRLIDFVKKNETKHLLNSYKPSIKRDNNTLALLFPYIIVHALQDCSTDQSQQIFEEFDAVFHFSISEVVKQPAYETSGLKEFLSTKYSVDHNPEKNLQISQKSRFDMSGITWSCAKLCSEQLDFLYRWLREWQRTSIVNGKLGEPTAHYKRVEEFANKFDKQKIAKANFLSGEFARALMYLEAYIEEKIEERLQEQLSFLIQIHGNLNDADSVEGAVHMKKSNLNLAEEIFVNRLVDRPQETITCYEVLMSRNEQFHQEHIKGMIDCYLRMEVPETALLIADGLWQKLTDQYTDDYFKECKSELLWRLCRYDELQEILEDAVVRRKTTNWNIQCSEAFLLFRQAENDLSLNSFSFRIDIIRSNILSGMRSFSGVIQNSYSNSYDDVIKLHLLRELEKCKELLNQIEQKCALENSENEKNLDELNNFFADWDYRLCIIKPIVRIVEPILCFRRNLLIETKKLLTNKLTTIESVSVLSQVCELVNNEIGKLWIRSAQLNREAGGLQQAHLSIMKAEEYKPKMLFLEKAKLLWDKGDQTNSFKLLEENLERIEDKCQKNITLLEPVDRSLYAEAKFLQATYNALSMNICSELNLRYFKEAIAGNRQSEKCYVQLAHYIEKIYESFTSEQKDGENGQRLLLEIMLNYARSLKYGFENVYQSMPRLLSLWLDFTSRCATLSEENSTASISTAKLNLFQELAKKMNDLLQNCSSILPVSLFYTAFSQLLSRICHPSNDVFNVLRTIIIKLVKNYPQQSLWMLLPIFKSSHTNRVKRCRLIFTDTRLAGPQFQKLLTNFNMLAERLIELTNKDVPLERSYELSSLVKQLPKLFKDPNFSDILLPFEKYMQVSLPILSATMSQKLNLTTGQSQECFSTASVPSNPFPYNQIYITGIKEEVVVLRSAAKPKKIIIQCNDGKSYEVMVKPKDDLRKDFRLMEFNGLVKRYLHVDSQARHRRLHIRTYAAIPFNEECGLVEWLPNLNSFRNICISIYRVRGLGIEDRTLKKFAVPKTDPIEKKRNVFVGTLIEKHPPVFQDWFRQQFPTPHSWYEARSTYVKSVAVMSMVGYILGLGDRHGENVLFDEGSGEAVHVDFNCLFNQGENFAYPELVPFRLTHNMVFAMGPLGIEGLYRKCCEITLRVLKKETKTLMSVLRPFVYDLVALNRSFNPKRHTGAEITDPKAMNDVRRIEERLQGYVNRTLANSMPLSTEGQVNFLISEATDIDNLAAMYIGWGAYL